MAEVSDFDIASRQTFLTGGSLRSTFFAGGRNLNKRVFIQISGLGGYRSGVAGISFRAIINGTSVGVFSFRRWTDHYLIVFDHIFLDFSSNILNSSGSNSLIIEPVTSNAHDYYWIGPVIIHFRQNS